MKLNIYKYFDINYDIKYFDETIEMLNCWRNIIEFGKKKIKIIKKGFVSKPVYDEKYLKTKIKSYKEKINKNVHGYEINFDQFCLRTGKNYNPQVFLEECKYVIKEKKMLEYITDEIEISSYDSDAKNSNKEKFNE